MVYAVVGFKEQVIEMNQTVTFKERWLGLFSKTVLSQVFLQTHNTGNIANIGIRKNPVTKCYPSEYWIPGPLIPSPTLSFLS